MPERLYIIGNGFDLHHGIGSSYAQFGDFLKNHHSANYRLVDDYFDVSPIFWAQFESKLAELDTDYVVEVASNFLASYGSDDWSDSYHHDYQYEIQQVASAISVDLRRYFNEWIQTLVIPTKEELKVTPMNFSEKSTFLNFNYTNTLQKTYGISNSNVLHIHGAASDKLENLILGHGWIPPRNLDPYRNFTDPTDADMRIVEGQSIIDEYFIDTFKDTKKIIQENEEYFRELNCVHEIFVLGHSLSHVDAEYFREIISLTNKNNPSWTITYHSDPDVVATQAQRLGINKTQTELVTMSELSG